MMTMLRAFFDPSPHPEARIVERAAEKVLRESHKLDRHKDAFADMIRGMRDESRPRSRPRKR